MGDGLGSPGFHRAELAGGFTVAIQQRRELIPNTPPVGAEPTVTVDVVAACLERAEAAGGEVLMPPTEIPGVGTVASVADPGGNPHRLHAAQVSGRHPPPTALLCAPTARGPPEHRSRLTRTGRWQTSRDTSRGTLLRVSFLKQVA
jgi:hypothetical protein